MNPSLWPAAFTSRVAAAMRDARRAAGLTMAEVAHGCTERGLESSEQTIKNLESGRKTTLAVTDFVVLADVLGVPPVSLLFPLGTAATMEILPGREVSTWDALAWFTGETPQEQPAPEGTARDVLDLFRSHGDLVAAALASTTLAKDRRRMAATALDRPRRAALLERAAGYEELAYEDCQELRAFRTRMQARNLVPPVLPAELAFIDDNQAENPPEEPQQ
jgi:transcriptional regulator with XRE-family HTH domain